MLVDSVNKKKYSYTDDWPPFGGAIPAEPVGNPTLWDSRDDEFFPGKQPLFVEAPKTDEYESPYQARAGTAYFIDSSSSTKPETGKDLVKKLFAESYGTWKWGGAGKCIDTDPKDCTRGESCLCERDDCPGGNCVNVSFCTIKVNGKDVPCEVASCPGNAVCSSSGECSNDSKLTCCPDAWGVCGTAGNESEFYGVCSDGSLYSKCQVNCKDCTKVGEGDYQCKDKGKEGKACCAKDPSYYKEHPDAPAPTCLGIAIHQCDAGDNKNNNCVVDECPGGSCKFAEQRYFSTAEAMWTSPQDQCQTINSKGDKVFVTERGNITDYCAVPPRVANIKVNGKEEETDAVILIRGGFATLTFTSHVDENQLPITGYKVDWGDGNKTIASGIKINQSPSVNNPHTLYHYYNYWDIKSKDITADDKDGILCKNCKEWLSSKTADTDCQKAGLEGVNICRLQPKVQIVDNWNWCNATTGKKNEGYYGSYCDSQTNAYTKFLGYIYITER